MMYALFLLPLFWNDPPQSDDAAVVPSTRTEAIEAERTRKAADLQPESVSRTEAALNYIKEHKILERITAGVGGVRVRLGGLITGSGFAIGPEYLRRDLLRGNMTFRTSARASISKYHLIDVLLSFPRLAGDHAFLDLYAVHRNYPRINYYGPGPSSKKTGRSDYRLEDTAFGFTAGVKPVRPVKLGATGGYLLVNTGRGTAPAFVSSEQIYSPGVAPGIDRQSNFLRGGVFAQIDWRDNPGGPRRGGNYTAAYRYYWDRSFDAYTFRRLELEAQQYVPFFNSRRVVALRGLMERSFASPGQQVPFYLQPTLGGSDDLRGFRPFRFYDDNLIVMNAEYRWEIFSGLDMAVFADRGKVFHGRGEWDLGGLEQSYGFGFRFNVRNDVFLRIDTGFSREGFQVWLKFNNVF